MIETDDFIIVHIPKCGGTTLRAHLEGKAIGAPHEGIHLLNPAQRRKKIYALTRAARDWYPSLFQYCVEQNNPWIEEFGVPYRQDVDTFRLFLQRATIDPPARQKLVIPTMPVSFDSFRYMRTRGRGFWSFWHEYPCSDDPSNLRIASDVRFVPMGDPRFYPPSRENVSTPLPIVWDSEMLGWLSVDDDVARIVARQTV